MYVSSFDAIRTDESDAIKTKRETNKRDFPAPSYDRSKFLRYDSLSFFAPIGDGEVDIELPR